MIVKDQFSGATGFRNKQMIAGGLTVLAVGFLLFVSSFVFIPSKPSTYETIYCGAEDKKLQGSKWVFENDGHVFRNGDTQTSEKRRSGRHSSRIGGDQDYGFYHSLSESKPGEKYYASVWRKREGNFPGSLVVNINAKEDYYFEESKASETDRKGWEKLEVVFTIPDEVEFAAVYVFGSGSGYVYFDDLEIHRISHKHAKNILAEIDTVVPDLKINIDPAGMRKINRFRKEALNSQILITPDDPWVKGKIIEGEETTPIKLRLKGDWVDHLRTDKWSFRIAVKDPFAWNRIVTFSIQNPRSRYYLHEWLYHQFLSAEDVLTTRYDLVNVNLNNESKGVYAYEEHFEKHLVEFRSRREGPILKMSEEGVWNARKRRLEHNGATEVEDEMNTYESAEIQPFGESKTLKNPVLKGQFVQAKTLLNQFKYGEKTTSEVFDLDRLAKFYAIIDITKAYHNIIWHNQRFYYNPVTSKLEPIGFDGYTELGAMKLSYRPLLGTIIADEEKRFKYKRNTSTFNDPALVEKYIYYLNEFTQPSYINAFLLSLKDQLDARIRLIQPEYPDYKFKPENYQKRAKEIQALLRPLDESGIKVFTQGKDDESLSLKMISYHILPLKVIGHGKRKGVIADSLSEAVYLASYDMNQLPEFGDLDVPLGTKYLFYQVPGLPEVYQARISPWPTSNLQTTAQAMFDNITHESNEVYEVDDNYIVFRPGKHLIEKDLIFPEGHSIVFTPGAELDFIKGAAFISRSPVQMIANEEEPIIIRSSDGTGQGFSILQAEGESILSYVRFDGMNTLVRKGWSLTGAVTFYESKVNITHSAFTNNHCEDGLNIVRSKFELRNSSIINTFADGLDVDFGKGTIANCNFLKTGNDGADFSGSFVMMEACNFESVGDKGISVGEKTTLRATDVIIDGAVTGVASKDLSLLRMFNPVIRNCQTGFAAYQKKPEFGGGRIVVYDYEISDVKFFKQIELGSELVIKEK